MGFETATEVESDLIMTCLKKLRLERVNRNRLRGLLALGLFSIVGSELSPRSGIVFGQVSGVVTKNEVNKSEQMNEKNPFAKPSVLPYLAPDFSAIKPEHFLPAFEAGIQQQLGQMIAIAEQGDVATFENTLVPMEKSGEILNRVAAVFFNLSGAHTNEAIQEIEQEIADRLETDTLRDALDRQFGMGRYSDRRW